MNMTFTEIQAKHNTLMEIGGMRLPRRISTAIARNIVAFEKEISFYTQEKNSIVERYARHNDNGTIALDEQQRFTFSNVDDRNNFLKEMEELNETQVDVPIMLFNEDILDRCEPENGYDLLTAIQEAKLAWMTAYNA